MRCIRYLLILISTLFVLSACGSLSAGPNGEEPGKGEEVSDFHDEDEQNQPEAPEPPADPEPTMAAQMLEAVNAARAAGAYCGADWQAPAPPLTLNSMLLAAAQAHSEDMLAMEKMTHTGSDGSNPGQRIDRAGYQWSTWGENVAYNYRSVEQVMAGWLGSPGHCRNLMSPNFTEFGAGEAGYYWTQVFARPRG